MTEVEVLWRRGGIIRVAATVADPEAYLRGIATAIGLTGIDANAWVAAVRGGANGIVAVQLRPAGAAYREGQMVELVDGRRGCIVHAYGGGGFEVECFDDAGETLEVVTVAEADIRAVD